MPLSIFVLISQYFLFLERSIAFKGIRVLLKTILKENCLLIPYREASSQSHFLCTELSVSERLCMHLHCIARLFLYRLLLFLNISKPSNSVIIVIMNAYRRPFQLWRVSKGREAKISLWLSRSKWHLFGTLP